ncbi:MAG: hypothetical protein IJI88_07880 [Atopobiaceae bacterium]|nr:hypothetical protein [Atopobiaceae bacterium]
MNLSDLSPDLIERAKACQSAEELHALAREQGLELSESQLQAVSAGAWDDICWTDVVMPDNPTT